MKAAVEKNITIGFVAAMAALFCIAVFGYHNITRSITTANEVHRSHQVIETLNDLLTSLIDADDASRRFVTSGDRNSIKLLRGAVPHIVPKLAELKSLTAGHPGQEKWLRIIDSLAAMEMARVNRVMTLHANDRIVAARKNSNAVDGMMRMRDIRTIIKAMDREENALLMERISATQFHARTAIILLLAGGCLSFFFVGMSKYLISRDARKRRFAEESLRISEERFQAAALATNDIIWDWDIITNQLWLSDPFTGHFGLLAIDEEGSILSRWRRFHPDDAIRVLAGIQSVIESGETFWCDEYRFCRADGTYASIYDRGYIIRDEAGVPVRMIGSMMDITGRKRAEDEIKQSRQQLRALAARIQSVREEEAKRIARKIHDELGQMLTGLKFDVQIIKKKLPPREKTILEKIHGMEAMVHEAMLTVQRISTEMRPGILEFGLNAAIEWQIRDFESRTGIRCVFRTFDENFSPENDETATAIFRIFQEILTNVARHAEATAVRISMDREDLALCLRVTDNGKGIPERKLNDVHSLGLIGMRERALAVGGAVAFRTVKEGGTEVTVRIPACVAPDQIGEDPREVQAAA